MSYLDSLLYRLFPGRCVLCQAPSKRNIDLCPHCQRDLPRVKRACWQCGLEMNATSDSCSSCISNPPVYSHCYSPYLYAPPLSGLIQQFKTKHQMPAGRVLGILLAQAYCRNHSHYPDLWLPVPLHKSTQKQRGFNQAFELCKEIATTSACPILSHGVRRIRLTQSQKQLTRNQRQSNMKGAFQCDMDLSGASIGIIDDVITTGATVDSLTNVLKTSGAADVQVVCIARTPAK